eukprot:TRINITY_DN10083_c1_g1_i1.p1 TRINITY_DN10083_c1_g1~~TRINITY_DN10083_c1_g1_i1.p1  ORF type:complete len:304 (+),score=101.97 TRINITY_DN10083_c1_g1_i1:69-980(+)
MSSDSSEAQKKKKSKKEKKEKEKEKSKKDKKEKKQKDESDKKRKRQDSDDDAGVKPNHGASGLLDDDEDPMPPPRRPAEREREQSRAEPSRSRDEPRQDNFGNGPDDDDGKGKGKGKGKDKGKPQWGKGGIDTELPEGEEKEEPNFEASGLLAVEDNAKNGIPLKFTRPAEARRPATKWRLYIFAKQQDEPKIVPIHKQEGYLFGKDRRVVDVPTDHPTCSKQHAVLHYRQKPSGEVMPYIMDLESVNGTFLNGKRIESARYMELREKDVLKFGMSTREFVLLHGGSANHIAIDPKALRSPSP